MKRTVYRTFCISALVYALYILQDRVVCLEERKSVTLIFIQDPSAMFQRPLLLGSLRKPRLIGLVTIQVICTFPKMMNWETCHVSSNWVYLNICYLYKNEVRIELNSKEPGMMIKMWMKEARAISLKFPFKNFTLWVVRDALAMGWGNLEILWLIALASFIHIFIIIPGRIILFGV